IPPAPAIPRAISSNMVVPRSVSWRAHARLLHPLRFSRPSGSGPTEPNGSGPTSSRGLSGRRGAGRGARLLGRLGEGPQQVGGRPGPGPEHAGRLAEPRGPPVVSRGLARDLLGQQAERPRRVL